MRIERHTNGWLYFGEGAGRWIAPDPAHDFQNTSSLASAYDYLANAPDTKAALEKLRLIRWAVRNVKVGDGVERTPRAKRRDR